MAASVSKFFVPDYFRRHTPECTQITPEPLNLRLAELGSARQRRWNGCVLICGTVHVGKPIVG
jgi:hypothetical protein